MRMYKIWRKITKNLAYMQEMSSRNVFFCEKNSLEFLFEGEELLIGLYVVYYLQILINILNKWHTRFHMRSVVVKIECFFLFVGHLFFQVDTIEQRDNFIL